MHLTSSQFICVHSKVWDQSNQKNMITETKQITLLNLFLKAWEAKPTYDSNIALTSFLVDDIFPYQHDENSYSHLIHFPDSKQGQIMF